MNSLFENINEILLEDQTIWATTVGERLISFNITQRSLERTPSALHNQMDGAIIEGDEMYVGLWGGSGAQPDTSSIIQQSMENWEPHSRTP